MRMSPGAPLLMRLDHHSMPEPNSGCVLWLSSVDRSGYGRIGVNGNIVSAARAAWMAHNGPIPPGLFVCHKCDVRSCINPNHLFLGTNAENMADMKAKGRGRPQRGAVHGAAKLVLEQVRAILRDVRTQAVIASEYGVAKSTIGMIKARRNWRNA